jgi:hypothetical protein
MHPPVRRDIGDWQGDFPVARGARVWFNRVSSIL